MVAIGRRFQHDAARHEALKEALLGLYLASLSDHGSRMDPSSAAELLALDIELNAQGMGVWLDRDARTR
jgi:hypothetical protein